MKDSSWYPVLFMIVLAAAFGAAVSAVAVATRERVQAGERARFRQHVLGALGMEVSADPVRLQEVWDRRIEVREDARGTYYVATAEDGTLRAYAFPFSGEGFWGPIRGILATDPAGREIRGIAFTQHQETPGLGGRITEPWFRQQFAGKPIPRAPGSEPPLRFVSGSAQGPREVEAITGATETSTRLGRFLNEFLRRLPDRPALQKTGGNP